MTLSFLKSAKIVSNEPVKRATGGPTKKDRNPIIGHLRVWKNGSVFPSATLVEKFNLEYTAKDAKNRGNGFDIIDSRRFGNTAQSEIPFLMIAAVSKDAPKVDLFGQVGYYTAKDELPEGKTVGSPINSVMSQGSTTGEELLALAKEVYNIEPNAEGFIDFSIVEGTELTEQLATATGGVYFFPKKVSRGEKAGQSTVVRRENVVVNVLVPTSTLTDTDMPSSEGTTSNAQLTSTEVAELETGIVNK